MALIDRLKKGVSDFSSKVTRGISGGEATLTTPVLPFGTSIEEARRTPLDFTAKPTPLSIPQDELSQRLSTGIERAKGADIIPGLKTIGQSIARSFAAISAAKEELQRGKDPFKAELIPTTEFQKKILGTEEAISFENIGREVASIIEPEPTKLDLILEARGLGKKEISSRTAIFLGLVVGGLDALPITSGKSKATYKAISKTNIIDDIFKLLKPIFKGSDNDIKALATGLKDVSDPKAVEQIITKIKDTPVIKPKAPVAKLGTKERKFITSVKKELPKIENKVAGQYIPRSTDQLAIKARNLIIDDIATAERIALTGSDESAVATASELLKHYAAKADEAADVATKNALYDQAAEVANTIAKKLTEQGRAVQAASILGRLTPEGQVRFAAREILKWNELNPRAAVPPLTGKQADDILTEMRTIQEMTDGIEKATRFQKLQDDIKALVPSRWWEKSIAVWKAGLLTGLKTSGLNIFSNISHAGTEIIKDVPAAATDFLLSLFTGKRTKAFTVKDLPSGVIEGAEKGWRYLKTGFDERNIAAKLDYKKINFKNKVVQSYVDSVFRVLGTEDQPFYYAAFRRSLHDQALAQSKNQGVKNTKKFVENLIKNPTDEMTIYAMTDAETAVFQNKTALGTLARGIQKIPGAEFVVPFGRTPSAVATQVINYTPVGPFIEIGKQIARGKFDQRLLSQAIGRGVVGTGVLWTGAQLFKEGLMTLDFPKTEKERELWKIEGRKANSIKIGGKWRTVQTLGPAGPALLIGGHLANSFEETGSPTEAITEATFGTIKSFTEQTFLRGVDTTLKAITDPERSAEFAASSFVSSFIPTIINDVARSKDEKERRSENVLQRIQSRIPALREKLEPQVTVLGEERPRAGNILETLIDPTRPSKDVSTPVVEELRRLTDEGFKISPTLLGDKKGFEVLTPKQNTELFKRAGEITNGKLTNLFGSEGYTNLSDDRKADIVDDFVDKSKIVARAEMVVKLTEGLSGDELKNKLSELKAGKLMTREVFNKYREIR